AKDIPSRQRNLLHEIRYYFELINVVILCSIVAVIGIIANVINIIVFYRQGLNNTVNITLTGLAISDLCCLITLLWYAICASRVFEDHDVTIIPSEVQVLTAGWPRACFVRITNWITVFITAERCLCVIAPLTVKKILTPKRARIVIGFIYVITTLPLIPEYSTAYLDWKFVEGANRTLFGLKFADDRPQFEEWTSTIYFIYIFLAYFPLIFLTGVLIYKLKQKTKWRQKSTFDATQSEKISSRDRKTINMVIAIAIVFIFCSATSVFIVTVSFFVPGFGITGENTDLFFLIWSFGFLLEGLNASVDIILYYVMSSRYKRYLHELFNVNK
ncbi:unnamed protein product, partial [Lymnaea stagnalis]